MTEQEWLAATDPQPMLEFLRGKASDRKLRLFAVACCRRLHNVPIGNGYRKAIDGFSQRILHLTESLADGLVAERELLAVAAPYYEWRRDSAARQPFAAEAVRRTIVTKDAETANQAASTIAGIRAWEVAGNSVKTTCGDADEETQWLWGFTGGPPDPAFQAEIVSESKCQSLLVRDIFGNSFRPVTLNPCWLTSTVKQLAESIYQERAFERLPILADALEHADCNNEDILAHCRQGGEHCRGCWVVDLVLGKE
jgi:hypothetical protein